MSRFLNNQDRIVRELPKTIALSEFELIFTSGNVAYIALWEKLEEPELLVHLSCDRTWYLKKDEAVYFISQFPLEYFAKTPKLAELHLDN